MPIVTGIRLEKEAGPKKRSSTPSEAILCARLKLVEGVALKFQLFIGGETSYRSLVSLVMRDGRMPRRAYVAALVASAVAFTVSAQDLAGARHVRAGRELAVTTCSECHVVVPRRLTPPRVGGPRDFVDIANERGMTRTALFVFLHTPHPTMPNLVLSDGESNDAIAYILSLRKQKSR